MATLLGIDAQAQAIALELGLDGWQIQSGSYNGVFFHIVPSLLNKLNQDLNPGAGIVDATNTFIGGLSGATPGFGDNSNLPYGTNTKSTMISDEGQRKLVIHPMPNNADVFEDLGWFGETFNVLGVLWGNVYSQALNNILNAFLNDFNALPNQRNVLVHPILGRIENVYLQSYRRIHNPNMWRSCLYEFKFRSSKPKNKITNSNSSIFNALNAAITAILTIATDLLNIWGDLNAIQNSFGNAGNSSNVQNSLKNSQKAVQNTVNTNLTVTKLMVSNLQPVGYTNVALNNTSTAPVNNIPSIYYFNSNMTPTDIDTITKFNADQVTLCISTINVINSNTIYNSITDLITIQTSINQLGISLLNSFYGNTKEYKVPYDTDLFNICFTNNLNYLTQAKTIWQLNKTVIHSANYIPKDTILLLPISTATNNARAQ